jgi:hypothetical protein
MEAVHLADMQLRNIQLLRLLPAMLEDFIFRTEHCDTTRQTFRIVAPTKVVFYFCDYDRLY